MDTQTLQTLIDAIPLRKSTRTFTPESLPQEMVDALQQFARNLKTPFPSAARFEFFTAEPGKKLYNNGVNPVHNMAVMAQTDLASISMAGFAGELVMLYAVSLGLSTCWFGHYNLAAVGRYVSGISSPQQIKESTLGYGYGKGIDIGERAVCCMPFGHRNTEAKRLVDFVAGKNGAKRKPLEELMEQPEALAALPEPLRNALELARLAPSAANSQFWRFGVSADGKTLTVAKSHGYKHFKWEHPDVDIGMCAAHMWLGLLQAGLSPKVEIRPDGDRALWTFTVEA